MRYRSQYALQLLTNKYRADVLESENKRRRLNRKTDFRGKFRIILTNNFNLCDNGKHLSNKEEKLVKTRNFIGSKVNACDEIPNSGCNMENLDTEGRVLL